MVSVKEAFIKAREFVQESFKKAREKLLNSGKKENHEEYLDVTSVKPVKIIELKKQEGGVFRPEIDESQMKQPLHETVKVSTKKVKLPMFLDVAKVKKVEAEKKRELEQELERKAKKEARKISLKTAVSETKKFQKSLNKAFAEIQKFVEEGKGAVVNGKFMNAKQLAMFVEKEKQKETLAFQEQLESGIKKFEEVEVPKAVLTAKKTTDFLKESARRTYSAVLTESGKPRFEFASKEAKKSMSKLTGVPKTGIRQEVGVGLGKAVATITGVPLIENEVRRQRAEREAIALVKGVSLGFLAPKSVALTPEEAFLETAGKQAGIQFIAAPLAEKTLSVISKFFPTVKEKLTTLPFISTEKRKVNVLRPKIEEVSYDVRVKELAGVSVGGESTATGTAYAFRTKGKGMLSVAEKSNILELKTGLLNDHQILQVGTNKALGKTIFIGKPQHRLLSPTSLRLFRETGRFPEEFPITEISRLHTYGKLPSELIAEGGEEISKFFAGQIVSPEKAVKVFFRVERPFGGKGIKGAKDVLSLISPSVRGKTFETSFGSIPGAPFEDISLALKQIAAKSSKVLESPIETIISLPKISAGAATAPIVVTATKTRPLELLSTGKSLFTIVRPVTTGIEKVVKEVSQVKLEPGVLSIFQRMTPLGIKQVQKAKIKQKVSVLTKVSELQKFAIKNPTLSTTFVKQKVKVRELTKPKTKSILKAANLQRVAIIPKIAKPKLQQKISFQVKTKKPELVAKPQLTLQLTPKKLLRTPTQKRKKSSILRTRMIKRTKKSKVKFVPRPDPITSLVTGVRLFGKHRKKLIATTKVKRVAKKLKKRRIMRFPTQEIISGELKIGPRGGLVSAFQELGIKSKKAKGKNKRRLKFI